MRANWQTIYKHGNSSKYSLRVSDNTEGYSKDLLNFYLEYEEGYNGDRWMVTVMFDDDPCRLFNLENSISVEEAKEQTEKLVVSFLENATRAVKKID